MLPFARETLHFFEKIIKFLINIKAGGNCPPAIDFALTAYAFSRL